MDYISILKPNFNTEYWLLNYYVSLTNYSREIYSTALAFSISNDFKLERTYTQCDDLIDTILLLTDSFRVDKDSILTALFEELFVNTQDDSGDKSSNGQTLLSCSE
jgi:hypothetical protein